MNTLRRDTEPSEQRGFAALLKGCFTAIRNPLAYEPKIFWDGEDDSADYLSLISLLHRRLDDCIRTDRGGVNHESRRSPRVSTDAQERDGTSLDTQAGAQLEFVTEWFEDTAIGRFILASRAFIAEVEREKIAERTMRGKEERARSGKIPQGSARLYGYRYNPASGRREVDEPRAGRRVPCVRGVRLRPRREPHR